jgi:hypothetical protein
MRNFNQHYISYTIAYKSVFYQKIAIIVLMRRFY